MKPLSLPMQELPCFPCVYKLEIGDFLNLRHMPLFPQLKTLEISKDGVESLKKILKKITSPPFSTLSHLEHLSVLDMEDSPEDEFLQYLTSLQRLEFYNCIFETMASDEKDGGVQWQGLKALTFVAFGHMENLV